MRATLITVLLFLLLIPITAQNDRVYVSGKSSVNFISDAPLELIQAENDQLLGALNVDERSFSFRVPIPEFEGFNTSLQKTHFNEEFMESDRYPNASFKGKIIEEVDLSAPGKYTIRAKGKLNVHGVENDRIIRCKITTNGNMITATADFTVFLDDHAIKIPSILNQKIAEEIKVNLDISMTKE